MKPTPGSSTRPLWSEEFSVYGVEDAYVLRRQFTKFLVLTSLGMVVGNTWIWLKSLGSGASASPLPRVPVARMSDVPVGGVKLFTYPGPDDPCILVHASEGQFTAFSQKCTHLSCAVYYSPDQRRLECPCHEGYFSVGTGRVLQGPPQRPLPRVVLERVGDQLVAAGMTVQAEEGR